MAALGCLLIVLIGAQMRLSGTDWDTGSNLHPDERHMMFVLTDTLRELRALEPGAMSPTELWFDAGKSPLDPRRNGQLYVYGELPHLVTVLTAQVTGIDGWPPLLRLGRTLGAIVDSYTILAVFLLAMLCLRNAAVALAAAAFYAVCPLALQLSNFFAVDSWLSGAAAWCAVSAMMVIRASSPRSAMGWAAVAGAVAGLALACKLPGVLLGGVVGVAVLVRFWADGAQRRLSWLLGAAAFSALAMLVVFRLACPFTFEGPSILGLTPTPSVIAGYVEMAHLVLDFGFPPNWQWMTGYNAGNALLDLAVWGLGGITSATILAGVAALLRRRESWTALLPLLVLCTGFCIYWLMSPAPALRYAIPTIPMLCVLAGAAALLVPRPLMAVVVLLACGWGSGIVALHTSTNSRVEASNWMWANLPSGTVVANESGWDDGLPTAVRSSAAGDLRYPDMDGHFSSVQLSLEFPDSVDKAELIATRLAQAEILVLSSERMRKPILALPAKFPMTAVYYEMLASGELCFERIYQNNPGYPVLGVRLDDSWAQEPWNVYDHPNVEIYRKTACFDASWVEARLVHALDRGS